MKAKFLKSNKFKAAIIFVAALLLLSIGYLEFISRRHVLVRVDSNRFIPTSITIQPGQAVTWINDGSKPVWPASNSHPTHQQYASDKKGCIGSELDACRAMNTAEQFSFRFIKRGVWGIHDHLAPGNIMTVKVSEVRRGWVGRLQIIWDTLFEKQSTEVNQLPSSIDFRALPYDEQVGLLTGYAEANPKDAWSYLKDTFIVNGQVVGQAHEFGHIIGNSAFKKLGMAGVGICDESFAYSCFHGVAEEGIKKQGRASIIEVEEACANHLSKNQQPSCFHGIGHGAATLAALDMSEALSSCDLMEHANREYCYDGVMMEHASVTSSKDLENNIWAFCNSLDSKYHIACGRYQPARLHSLGWNTEKIIKSCSDGSTDILKEHCFRSSGFGAASANPNNPSLINSQCDLAGNIQGFHWCMISAATELTFQRYEDAAKNALEVCSYINEAASKLECMSSVESIKSREGI